MNNFLKAAVAFAIFKLATRKSIQAIARNNTTKTATLKIVKGFSTEILEVSLNDDGKTMKVLGYDVMVHTKKAMQLIKIEVYKNSQLVEVFSYDFMQAAFDTRPDEYYLVKD